MEPTGRLSFFTYPSQVQTLRRQFTSNRETQGRESTTADVTDPLRFAGLTVPMKRAIDCRLYASHQSETATSEVVYLP